MIQVQVKNGTQSKSAEKENLPLQILYGIIRITCYVIHFVIVWNKMQNFLVCISDLHWKSSAIADEWVQQMLKIKNDMRSRTKKKEMCWNYGIVWIAIRFEEVEFYCTYLVRNQIIPFYAWCIVCSELGFIEINLNSDQVFWVKNCII